jgi:hypothetical protein
MNRKLLEHQLRRAELFMTLCHFHIERQRKIIAGLERGYDRTTAKKFLSVLLSTRLVYARRRKLLLKELNSESD